MKMSSGWVSMLLAGVSLVGCADDSTSRDVVEDSSGKVQFPLVSSGPSGAKYTLRNATFRISPSYCTYCGAAGGGGAPSTVTVSSETNPGADTIEVSLERGNYYVTLLDGWSMQVEEDGVTSTVEAQLLSSQPQYLYVSPGRSTWVKFQFGIGERSVWFNGTATIDMDVYEDAGQYYGYAGAAGRFVGVAGGGNTPSVAGARGY